VLAGTPIQMSMPRPLLAYAAPTIDSISGCPISVNVTLEDCPRDTSHEPARLTIHGHDFGPANATILVGASKCVPVEDTTSSQIVCSLPSGRFLAQPILIVQSNGRLSASGASVSYRQCGAGTYEVDLMCLPCPNGTMSTGMSQLPHRDVACFVFSWPLLCVLVLHRDGCERMY
jgi:hypothetical protein